MAPYAAGRRFPGGVRRGQERQEDNRPQLAAALALCRQKRVVLAIAKLDSLARLVAFISNLMESGVEFVAVDMPQADQLTLHILAAVAEHEREMISQGTRAALRAAKAKGVRLGNPRPDMIMIGEAAVTQARRFRVGILPLISALEAEGRSLRGIAAELNARGVASARDRNWHAASVRSILEAERDQATT